MKMKKKLVNMSRRSIPRPQTQSIANVDQTLSSLPESNSSTTRQRKTVFKNGRSSGPTISFLQQSPNQQILNLKTNLKAQLPQAKPK
jgi:hypothetical protein